MASGITSMNPSLSISKTSKTLQSKMTSSLNKGIIFSSCSSVATTSSAAVPQKRCLATSVAQTRTALMEISDIRHDDVIHTTTPPALAQVWREIQGSNDWHELVDPLDPLLRDEIIRYGEFVSACYKAFDFDPSSKRYLKCKHGRKNILKEVGLRSSGYEVTKYVYATPGIDIPTQDSSGRWIGYVAVSSDSEVRRLGRRDIMVALRGTVTNAEWVANLMSPLTPARIDPHNPRPDVKVESGFLSLYASDDSSNKFSHGSCRQQLLCEIQRLLDQFKHEDVSITLAGHSMGSSLALLFGYDLAELGLNVDGSNGKIPITVYSFAGPRVGNLGFKERCEELGVKVLRVVNVNDPITKLPGVFLNENYSRVFAGKYELPWRCSCYAHVGVELSLDFFNVNDPSCVHDLEHLIRLLRCPKMIQAQERKQEGVRIEVDLFHKAREFFESQMFFGSQTLNSCLWQDAAINVCNMIQSLGCIY